MKILYVTTISSTVNAFLIPHIKLLRENGHQIDVASHIQSPLKSEVSHLVDNIYDVPFQRSPLSFSNLAAYKKLRELVNSGKYDVIHTHTPVASFLSRMVCRNIEEIKIIYTAHGFHFFKGAPLKNWLLYFPIERYLSKYTDILITMNKEDFTISKDRLLAKDNISVSGVGLDVSRFSNSGISRTSVRQKLGISPSEFLIISIGELSHRKNHKVIIDAIKDLNVTYIICGKGDLEPFLHDKAKKNNARVKLLGHRSDICELLSASDLFIFPSIHEGLPVSLMEAMSCELPVVCSDIRGNNDLIENGKGGYLVLPYDFEGFRDAISTLMNNNNKCVEMGQYNKNKVKAYSLENVLVEMDIIYKKIEA